MRTGRIGSAGFEPRVVAVLVSFVAVVGAVLIFVSVYVAVVLLLTCSCWLLLPMLFSVPHNSKALLVNV